MIPSRTLPKLFHQHLQRYALMPAGASVLVAVSGGIDSTVLLDLLVGEGRGRLAVAHVNHGLRGAESEGDEKFVRELAAAHGLKVFVGSFDTTAASAEQGTGIQETARALRYAFLEKVRREEGFDLIATAHTADDHAETVLMHLVRGSGLRGLAGIPRKRDAVVRPLLFADRASIAEYARERGLEYREDSSNAGDHYTRNVLRHHVMPAIRERVNPGLSETLLASSEMFREADVFFRAAAAPLLSEGDGSSLPVDRLMASAPILQWYAAVLAIERATGSPAEQAAVTAVAGLLANEAGAEVSLPGGWRACRERSAIVFRRGPAAEDFTAEVKVDTAYDFGAFRFSSEFLASRPALERTEGSEVADADRLGGEPLVLRWWREGDWFVPLGMTGRKKISDYLVDAHVPREEKQRVPLLTTAAGDTVWLCGHRLDDRFKVTGATTRFIRFHCEFLQERMHAQGHRRQW